MSNIKKQKGYAALLIIFVLGMVSVLIASSLLATGYGESLMGRTTNSSLKAFYAANSGVEDAVFKIRTIPNFGVSSTQNFTLPVDTASAAVTVTGSQSTRQITSVGTFGVYARKIVTTVQNTSVTPGFIYAIQAGTNGIEIDQQSSVKATSGDGNAYSNGYIAGAKSDTQAGACKNSASAIFGSVWAVTNVDKLANNDKGPCVTKDASANSLNYCHVFGKRNAPSAPSGNCDGGTYVNTPAPTPIPLPDMNIQGLKNYLTNKGTTFSGDCTADGTLTSCGGVTNTVGNLIITGTLTVPSNKTLTVSGPVWVKGNIIFNSNVIIALANTIGQMVITDGIITSNSNVTFGGGGTAFLLFLSTYNPYPSPSPTPTPGPSSAFCNTPAITVQSNTNDVLFYAPVGCVSVSSNSTFNGAILGEKIVVNNNSTVNYDPNLANAIFTINGPGGWQIQSFAEQ